MGRRMQHVSWVIKTDQGNITVHLGPSPYLNQQQLVINPGDAVEVTGSQIADAAENHDGGQGSQGGRQDLSAPG